MMSPIGQLILLGITAGSMYTAAKVWRESKLKARGVGSSTEGDGSGETGGSADEGGGSTSTTGFVPPCVQGTYEPGNTIGASAVIMGSLAPSLQGTAPSGARYPKNAADAVEFVSNLSNEAMEHFFNLSMRYAREGHNPTYTPWINEQADALLADCDFEDQSTYNYQRFVRAGAFAVATLAKENVAAQG